MKAIVPNSEIQETKYLYGVTEAGGSDINSNDILVEVHWPDKSTGAASSSEKETFTVNALGQTKTATDRNGNVYTYSFDVLGRLTADAVTTLGTGVDGAVRRLEVAYDGQGNPHLFTSYDAATSGNVVNQVQREFNGLGQLITEYEEHSGAVNTGTSEKVQYAYSEMSGGANHSRIVSMTYPDGRVLNYNYGTGLNDNISRLVSIFDNSATLEEYDYLGLGTVVRRGHPEPDVDQTFIKQSGESNGDAGDPYIGLDRFGRIVDQRWLETTTPDDIDRFQYGYDRNSNRTYRENALDAVFSELYAYDDLNQLIGFDRGELNGTKDGITGTPSRSQDWDLDATGNWDSVTNDGGTPESRTHNSQNQVTGVGSATLTFDANGNMTTDETGRTLGYDAWNRLVDVDSTGRYAYDALGRRIKEGSRALYYSANWQVIEERESGVAVVQQVWSPVYIDALILRDRDTDSNGSLDERLYVLQDANWNVTALVDSSGNVVERYVYDPYGAATIYIPDWSQTRSSSDYDWQYLHQGGRYDATSGLIDFRGRVYRPTLGRWEKPDPIGFGGGDLNLYRALGNNPANFVDPNGLDYLSDLTERTFDRVTFGLSSRLRGGQGETLSDRFFGLFESGYDRPAWRGGNFLREPNPQPSSGTDFLTEFDQRMMNRIRRSNAGETVPPLTAGSLPIYGSDGNRTAAEAMVEAGQTTRNVMRMAMIPFYFTPYGRFVVACSAADHVANGEYWEAGIEVGADLALSGVPTVARRLWSLSRARGLSGPGAAQGRVTFNSVGGSGGSSGGGWSWGNWFRFWRDRGGATQLEPTGSIPFFRRYRVARYLNRDLPGTPGHLDTMVHEGTHIGIGRYFPQLIDAGKLPLVGGPFNLIHETIAYSMGRIATGRIHALPLAPFQAFWKGLKPIEKAEVIFFAYLGYRYYFND